MPGWTPLGQRSSVVGRSRSARMIPSPTASVVLGDLPLVTSAVRAVAGKITRSGLETRTARPPASTWIASDATSGRLRDGWVGRHPSPAARQRNIQSDTSSRWRAIASAPNSSSGWTTSTAKPAASRRPARSGA